MTPFDSQPVSTEEEAFVFNAGDDGASNGKSKYVFAKGTYPGKVVSITSTISRTGNPQFVVGLVGTGGPAKGLTYKMFAPRNWVPSDPGYSTDKENPKNLWKFDALLDAVGVPAAQVVDGKKQPRSFKKTDVVGKDVGMNLSPGNVNESGKQFMDVDKLVSISKVPAEFAAAGGTAGPSASEIPF